MPQLKHAYDAWHVTVFHHTVQLRIVYKVFLRLHASSGHKQVLSLPYGKLRDLSPSFPQGNETW